MTDEDATKAVRVLLGFYAADLVMLSEQRVDDMITAYTAGLRDLELGDVDMAIARLARSQRRMPKVADIRDAVVANRHGRARNGVEAWGDVQRAIVEWGKHDASGALLHHPGVTFDFRDPLVHAVVESLGWSELVDSDNRVADRARFVEAYEERAKAVREDAKISPNAETSELPAATEPVIKQLAAGRGKKRR